jgi:hypothetical protein
LPPPFFRFCFSCAATFGGSLEGGFDELREFVFSCASSAEMRESAPASSASSSAILASRSAS